MSQRAKLVLDACRDGKPTIVLVEDNLKEAELARDLCLLASGTRIVLSMMPNNHYTGVELGPPIPAQEDGTPGVIDLAIFRISSQHVITPDVLIQWVKRARQIICVGTSPGLVSNDALCEYAHNGGVGGEGGGPAVSIISLVKE
jgi:hypothetical protein